jgi:hypothetical protein
VIGSEQPEASSSASARWSAVVGAGRVLWRVRASKRACRCAVGRELNHGGRKCRNPGVEAGRALICGQVMATAKIYRSAHGGLMEESSGCENGVVSSRRRRMEIRGFKMMTNSSSFVEQPVTVDLTMKMDVQSTQVRL